MTVTTTTTTTSARTLEVRAGEVARQGDLVMKPIEVPTANADGWAAVGPDGAIIADGRAAHVVRGDARIRRRGGDALHLADLWVGEGGAVLAHERGGAPAEHAALALAPGAWAVMAQRVVNAAGDIRAAVD